LTFSHPLAEDGTEKANYDYGSGVLTINLPKLQVRRLEVMFTRVQKGQFFESLDMLTKLLAKKNPLTNPLIETLTPDIEGSSLWCQTSHAQPQMMTLIGKSSKPCQHLTLF
jgi:hypothetical protein